MDAINHVYRHYANACIWYSYYEYLKIGANTALECMKNFTLGVIEVFGDEYLRKPNQADVDRLLKLRKAKTFPVCWEASTACTGSGRIIQ